MRLDKYLSEAMGLTRSESRTLVSKGKVALGGVVCKKADTQVDESSAVTVEGKPVCAAPEFVYIMLNKPEGVVSAAEDKRDVTVVDLVQKDYPRRELFPAGRLDKTSTGFVLLTDDGGFAHDILSPRHHVAKSYVVEIDTPCTSDMVKGFAAGVTLADGTKLAPAELKPLAEDSCKAVVVLKQGVYHQIKRMFGVFDAGVNRLHRSSIGDVQMDARLAPGEYRELTADEVEGLRKLSRA